MGDRIVEDFDTQSWKDRCDRYFTSISEASKDIDQEIQCENGLGGCNGTRQEFVREHVEHDENIWKDMSDIRKRWSEHRLIRKARDVFARLDIHGSRMLSKSDGSAGFVIGLVIFIICLAGFGVGLYFLLIDIVYQPTFYRLVKTDTFTNVRHDINVAICNINKYKKSNILLSQITNLKQLIGDLNSSQDNQEQLSVQTVFSNNAKLNNFVMERLGATKSIEAELENDVIIQEMVEASNTSLINRLSLYGRSELLHEVIAMSKEDTEKLGHRTEEMLIKCWIDNGKCSERAVRTMSYINYGQCFSVQVDQYSTELQLLLDANSSEYIEALSPYPGFLVMMSRRDQESTGQRPVQIPTGFYTTLEVDKVTSITRLKTTCSQRETKRECEYRCFKRYVSKICGCTLTDDSTENKSCEMDKPQDYICIKALKIMSIKGSLDCQCVQSCSEQIYSLQMTSSTRLSKNWMLQHVLQNKSDSYVWENMAVVTIHLTPRIYEEINEEKAYTVLDVFVRLGGLSAFILSASLVTVVEIIFLLIKGIVGAVHAVRRRENMASPRRLSDSEITSITWAMYRQRRRFEEMHKAKLRDVPDTLANNAGLHIARGNVQSRISKRSSNVNKNLPNGYHGDDDHFQDTAGKDNNLTPNGYFRRYEGRYSGHNQARTRKSYAMATRKYDLENNGSNCKTKPGSNHSSIVHTPSGIDNRDSTFKIPQKIENDRVTREGVYYLYDSSNKLYHSNPDSVVLYNGSTAYFSSPRVSEPVYL